MTMLNAGVRRTVPFLRVLFVASMSNKFSQDNQQGINFKKLLRYYQVFGYELVLMSLTP